MHMQNQWHYLELQMEITLVALAPALRFLLKIGMCLQGLMQFPSVTLIYKGKWLYKSH